MARGPAKRRRRESSPPAAAAASGGRKLLAGEHVEVLSCDPGLCGSWHQAVVIGIFDNARTVRYTDFVDDNGLPLVENVQVSDAIDGKSRTAGELIRGRGNIMLVALEIVAISLSPDQKGFGFAAVDAQRSELRRLDFRGFYTILLHKGGDLVSVGTFRVCGKKFAELPLIGTRVPYRRQGMCRLLMNELEKLLLDLGVERLLLPAVPELLKTWTGSFGFTVMSNSDRIELSENSILSFDYEVEDSSIISETMESDHHEGPSVVREDMEQLEPKLVREIQNNSGEEGISAIDAMNIMPDPQVGLAAETELTLEIQNNSGEEGICSFGALSSTPDSRVGLTVEPDMVLEIRNNSSEEGSCSIDASTSGQVGLTVDMHGSAGADQISEKCTLTEEAQTVTQKTAPGLTYKFSGKCYERVKNGSRPRNVWLRVSTK
nr:unnamed protein product [Digitaria exilis]